VSLAPNARDLYFLTPVPPAGVEIRVEYHAAVTPPG
jgi:hypothetical protein